MQEAIMQAAVCQKPTLENSIHYIAHTFSFLATGEDTANAFSLIHCNFRKGFLAPPHYHKLEDESFYILDGKIDFHVGDKKFTAGAGEFVVLPKNVPHQFDLITDTAKALLLITPGGFETFFKEFGRPAQTLDLPPIPTENPRQEMFDAMNNRMMELESFFVPDF
ncbi:MAG TPA: cupin domain-containing protein [Chitinophagaceae bacterium]|nr:cupin domain-containing protein [Chitinophagaceae bacterium]